MECNPETWAHVISHFILHTLVLPVKAKNHSVTISLPDNMFSLRLTLVTMAFLGTKFHDISTGNLDTYSSKPSTILYQRPA